MLLSYQWKGRERWRQHRGRGVGGESGVGGRSGVGDTWRRVLTRMANVHWRSLMSIDEEFLFDNHTVMSTITFLSIDHDVNAPFSWNSINSNWFTPFTGFNYPPMFLSLLQSVESKQRGVFDSVPFFTWSCRGALHWILTRSQSLDQIRRRELILFVVRLNRR